MTKQNEEYSLVGVIIDAGKFVRGADRTIVIQTPKGNKYRCIVPASIFSNFQEDDFIECRVCKNKDSLSSTKIKNDDGEDKKKTQETIYTMLRTPFTQLGTDRDNIERCFIRALKGTNFGAKSASILYDGLKTLAKRAGYCVAEKKKISDIEEEEEEEIKTKSIKKNKKKSEEEEEEEIKTKSIKKNKKKSEESEEEEKEKEEEEEEEKTKKKNTTIPGMPLSTTKVKLIPEIVGYDGVIPLLSELADKYNNSGNKESVEILINCGGIRDKQAQSLLNWWYKSRSLRRLHLLGLTNKEIEECRMNYDEIYQSILTNPFKLAPLPIEKCISLMGMLNKEVTDDHIKCAEILRKIYSYVHQNAYTCVLLTTIEYHFPKIYKHLDDLTKNYGIVLDGRHLYLEYNYIVEVFVANFIDDLIKKTAQIASLPEDDTASVQTAKYTMKTLTEEQKLAITGGLHNKISVITGPGGCGKCLDPDTGILMYDGSIKKAGEVEKGDLLMGDDSTSRTVLSTTRGKGQMYEIHPKKGKPFVCNGPHILTLKGITPFIKIRSERNKKFVAIFSIKGRNTSKAFKTKKEAKDFIEKLEEDIFDIPLNELLKYPKSSQKECYLFHNSVEFEYKEVPMDPYMIGYWLGDGTSENSNITTADPEVVEYFEDNLKCYGLELKSTTAKYGYSIIGDGVNYRKKGANAFINTLRSLNLLNNKHIPDIYKINSRHVRLELLAGLIDSDGYRMGDTDCYEIIQKNEQLANDIEYLCYSLGFMVTKKEVEKGCMYKNLMRMGIYHKLCIFGDGLEEITCALERKQCEGRKMDKRATCQSFEVIPIEKKNYAGFELDGNGRFLLDDFTVTHNSTISKEIYTNFDLRGIKMVACAFTGKAVTRLNKCLGARIARTMDFMIMRASQIEKFDLVLIDECSMVTTELIYRFKQAFPFEFSIILVGDCNQLPPISWGFFMKQIIACDRVPIYTLTRNQRIIKHTMTAEEETAHERKAKGEEPAKIEFDRTILENCERLIDPKRDLSFPMEFKEGSGFYSLEGNINTIETLLQQLSNLFEVKDITCISPYNEYIRPINIMFQSIFLSDVQTIVDRRGRTWKKGDRVMMLKNNYTINIMNGEEGEIVSLDSEGVKVRFEDGVEHQFLYVSKNGDSYGSGPNENMNNESDNVSVVESSGTWDAEELVCDMIQHSFCVSVHKSQGSEYRIVLIFIPDRKNKKGNLSTFLNINLAYTAITRTKQAVWIVAPPGALGQISINKLPIRVDNLAGRLSKMKDEELEKSLEGKTKIKFVRELTEDDDDDANYDIPFDIDD
jgi:hypothetical protein